MKLSHILLMFLLVGCTTKALIKGDTKSFNEEGGLEGQLIWVKNKRTKMDLNLRFRNNYNHAVVIQQNAVSMNVGDQKNIGADKPNQQILLREGDVLNSVVTLNFDSDVYLSGDSKILVRHIYEYNTDKGSQGKKLKDLEISLSISSRSVNRRE